MFALGGRRTERKLLRFFGIPFAKTRSLRAAHRFYGANKTQATMQVLLVSGGLLLGSALGFFGVLYAFPLLTVFGAVILFGESAFILTLAPLTLAGAVLLLPAARKARLEKRTEPPSGPCTLEN